MDLRSLGSDISSRGARGEIAGPLGEYTKRHGIGDVDQLYQDFLDEAYGPNAIDSDYQNFQSIVGALINQTCEPYIPALQNHLGDRIIHDVRYVLTKLQCILEVQSEKLKNDTLLVVHSSFVDFITAPSRCKNQMLRIKKK